MVERSRAQRRGFLTTELTPEEAAAAVKRVGRPRGSHATPPDLSEARRYLRAGFSLKQTATLFGVSRSTLYRWLRRPETN